MIAVNPYLYDYIYYFLLNKKRELNHMTALPLLPLPPKNLYRYNQQSRFLKAGSWGSWKTGLTHHPATKLFDSYLVLLVNV